MENTNRYPPEGCTCIEDEIYEYEVPGPWGWWKSMRYTGGAHQYTEKEMQKRVRKLRWKVMEKERISRFWSRMHPHIS